MNRKGSKTVLALYPNQLGFGYALMENALTLKDYQIVVSRPMSNKYLLKRIRELIKFYEPEIVILEDIKTKRTIKSKRVQELMESILSYAVTNKIPFALYTREQIREVFLNFKAKSKFEIASTIAQNIPALKNRLGNKDRNSRIRRGNVKINQLQIHNIDYRRPTQLSNCISNLF